MALITSFISLCDSVRRVQTFTAWYPWHFLLLVTCFEEGARVILEDFSIYTVNWSSFLLSASPPASATDPRQHNTYNSSSLTWEKNPCSCVSDDQKSGKLIQLWNLQTYIYLLWARAWSAGISGASCDHCHFYCLVLHSPQLAIICPVLAFTLHSSSVCSLNLFVSCWPCITPIS